MHVAEAGSGDPLVLVHGWPQHWYCWRKVIPPLAERYRVICPDLRGHGWTDAPRGGYDKETFAADLIALLDVMGLDRVRLVGHDWGGYTGFLVSLLHPERVERYMPLNIVPPWGTRDPRVVFDLWRLAYQVPLVAPILGPRFTRWFPGAVEAGMKRSATTPDTFSAADLRAFSEPLKEPARAHATAATYRAFQLRDLPRQATGRYNQIRLTVPTLLLFGTQDMVLTERMLAGYEKHADDMRVERYPQAGHFIAEDCPDVVADRALEFFAA